MDEQTKSELAQIAQTLEAMANRLRRTIPNQSAAGKTGTAVRELTFSTLKYELQQGAKLGEYEVAHKAGNIEGKWHPAYNILLNSNATIKDRYCGEGYQYGYWLYGEDKIYRQKLKPKTGS